MTERRFLQARSVNDLHVNSKLAAIVVEDEGTDATAARLKGGAETRPEVGLVNNSQVLLDIASLGHGNNVAALEVKHTVLLEDGTEHGLYNHAGGGVGDEGRLLMQLAGEEINAEVAVLAGGRRGRDTDDLAGASLQHQEVTNANVVARNSDRVGQILASLRGATAGSRALTDLYVDVILMMPTGVDNAVSKLVHAVAEGVVVTVFVVVTHLGLLISTTVTEGLKGLFGDLDVLSVNRRGAGAGVDSVLVDTDVFRLESLGLRSGVYGGGVSRAVTLAIFTFDVVNGAAVRLAMSINLNMSICVLAVCRSAIFLDVLLLRLVTGTAAKIFFTGKTDFFLVDLVRRVLAFPSGC